MTNQTVQLFNFDTATIRVIPDFKDGQPYFVAKDVAEALGYKNTSKAVKDNCLNAANVTGSYVSGLPNRGCNIIPESDLYRLVMRSNLPSAQAFQSWVCETVLPAIRKDGAYIMGEEKVTTGELNEDEFVLRAMNILQCKVDRLKTENQRLETELEKMTVRQWEVDVRKGYLSKQEKGRLAGQLRGKAVEKIAAKYGD